MNKIPPKPKDKRTRRYKEWVAKFENSTTGLGDTVEKITKATGIKAVVDKVFDALGQDCGCDERKEKMNKLYPYNKPNCFLEDEYDYVKDFLSLNTNRVTPDQQTSLLDIYNRIFNTADKVTNCGVCFKEKIRRLKSLIDQYE